MNLVRLRRPLPARIGFQIPKLLNYRITKLQNPLIDASPSCSLLCRVPLTTSNSRLRVSDDISKLVGETPMLQMKKLAPPGSADIFAKLEYLNPGGSVKDRAAIGLIARAESEGKLKPGGTVIEATAGNTGIGLALIGRASCRERVLLGV